MAASFQSNGWWWLKYACWLVLVAGGSCPAGAHPFHISTAEVEYDATSDRLQVSLKLQAIDLEQALAKIAGRRIDIEQPQAEKPIVELLRRTFYLAPAELPPPGALDEQGTNPLEPAPVGKPSPPPKGSAETGDDRVTSSADRERTGRSKSQVHWVGQELKGAWLWLYFELELPAQRQELRLYNTVLFETNDSQINTVSVRHGAQRTTLKMTPKQPSANFDTQWLNGE